MPKAIDITTDELPQVLESFYSKVQKKPKSDKSDDAESYKNIKMRTIRAAIARFYRETRSLDIISNEQFIRTNAVFTGLQKINKKKGLGTIQRKTAVSETDMQKLMEYFRVQIICDLNPKNLQNIVNFYILFYMCCRGRENLRAMKQFTFDIAIDPQDQRKYIN